MILPRDAAVGERLSFGDFELAPAARALWRAGAPVKLGSRALDILIALTSRPGEILSKEELIRIVWQGAFVDETALRVGISAARKALGGKAEQFITTIPGRGYCFVLDVEARGARTSPAKVPRAPLKPRRLPAQIARVVGRDEVTSGLVGHVTRFRLVSLVGPGGIGKTTVALVIAARLSAEFDAVAFVDLTPIENAGQISASVALALGLNLRNQQDPLEDIVAAVDGLRVLLIFDNCEHVVELAAAYGEALLGSAPGITILATSRERLRAAGEWVHHLSPLDVPPDSSTRSAEETRGYSAVELFEERAAFALGGYQINDKDAPYIAEICRRLDGIALAIELAAGRLAGLGVQGLASSLEDSFSILTHGRRTDLPRHQTLRATLDWSYRLLSPEGQATLRCLSTFNGSFTLEDAAFVMGPLVRSSEANEPLTNLLEKSLVVARPEEGEVRYHLLETTRAYAQDKLEESGEADPKRARHAQRFLQVCSASALESQIRSSLRLAMADVRAALDWSLVRGADKSLGVDLAAAASMVFLRLSLLGEHRRYLDLALAHIAAHADTEPVSEAALRSEMILRRAAAQAEHYTEGLELSPEKQLLKAKEIARDINDKPYELKIIWMLYGQAGNVGSYRRALLYAKLFEETANGLTDSMAQFRSDRMLARALSDLGNQGLALQHVKRALRLDRAAMPPLAVDAYEIDDWVAARAILARTLWLRGYPDDAKTAAERCIAEALQVGHEQSTCWAIAFNLCPVAIWRGDFGQAAALVAILLERSQREFQRYYQWGLLYQRFLAHSTVGSAQVDAVRHFDIELEIPAQADLFATFDDEFAGHDSLARAQEDENIWCAPELLRAQACRLVLSGNNTDLDAAEVILLRSLRLAKRQDAGAWQLRTATSLALLYLRLYRSREARAVLEPTVRQFKQGRETQDVQAAMNVLSALPG